MRITVAEHPRRIRVATDADETTEAEAILICKATKKMCHSLFSVILSFLYFLFFFSGTSLVVVRNTSQKTHEEFVFSPFPKKTLLFSLGSSRRGPAKQQNKKKLRREKASCLIETFPFGKTFLFMASLVPRVLVSSVEITNASAKIEEEIKKVFILDPGCGFLSTPMPSQI